MSKQTIYLIRALSNLHAGAGDRSFGLIDKHVQRDHTTNLPVVFASSLKGALRELVHHARGASTAASLFGTDNERGGAALMEQGRLVFSDARLLAIPVRSSHQLYYMATTPTLIEDFIGTLDEALVEIEGSRTLDALKNLAPAKGKPIILGDVAAGVYLEHLPSLVPNDPPDITPLRDVVGPRLAVMHLDDFATLCKNLPTVARNALDNGISENLWYEELVPRETRFYATVEALGSSTDAAVETAVEDLDGAITAANGRRHVQLGANATVGNGRTLWTPLNN
jgi:CRISPR-associated protein Cmr4